MDSTIIRAYKSPQFGRGVQIFLGNGGKTVKTIEWEETKAYAYRGPDCTMEETDAQALMDDLWSCGLRPSEGAGSAGSLKATQNHLADIKTILWKKLGIES